MIDVHGAVQLTLTLSGLEVAVYCVIGLPPSSAGAANVTVACAVPAVALTPVGAPGTVVGVTAFDGDDAGPGPMALVAVTVNVYAWSVRPVTVIDAHGAVQLAVRLPGLDVAV